MLNEPKTWLINEPSRDKTCLQDFPPGPNTNWAVRPQNMTICLKFRNKGVEELYYIEFNFVATAQLICVFVFVYAKSRFSHDAAQRNMVY